MYMIIGVLDGAPIWGQVWKMESASLFPGNLTREEGDKAASLSGASSTNEVTLSAGRFLVAGWPCKRGKVEPSSLPSSNLLLY